MAHELFKQFATGRTLYCVLRGQSTGKVVLVANGNTETNTAAHWNAGNYSYPLTDSASTGMYDGPASPIPTVDDTYDVEIFWQAGGSSAVGDTLIGTGLLWVYGGAIVNRQVNVQQILGTTSAGAAGSVAVDQAQALVTLPAANTLGEALFILDNIAGRINTAAGGASSTITLDASANATDGAYTGFDIFLYSGTGGGQRGVGQQRTIVSYVGSTKVATVNRPWGTTPDNTSKYILYYAPKADVFMWAGDNAGVAVDANHLPKVDVEDWHAVAVTTTVPAAASATVAANMTQIAGQTASAAAGVTFPASIGTSTYSGGAVASVTGNVGGNVVGSVGSVVATVAANLVSILGTVLTETSGQIAAAFKKFFNVAAPAGTVNLIPEVTLVDTLTTYTGNTPQTADVATLITTVGSAGAGLTALAQASIWTSTIAGRIDATISSRLATSGYTAPDNADIATILTDVGALQAAVAAIPTSPPATVTLAASQPNYAPSKAGDKMDLVDAPNAAAVTAIQGGLATSAQVADVYHADIQLSRKTASTATDTYSVVFLKSGVRQTSGITVPTITVTNEAGTALISAATLTQVGSTDVWQYNATGGALIVPPDTACVVIAWTQDAMGHSFPRNIGRDA